MGAAGAGSLAQVINAAMTGKERFVAMAAFFDGVGTGATAGVWEDLPHDRADFREAYKRKLEAKSKARKVEEIV
jgi:3,8-divinyl chlorophyllide a/chlorophyllide a reductase subunit Y